MNGHLEGELPYLGELLSMVINHLLTGMILQVANRLFGSKWDPEFFMACEEIILI